MIVVSNTIKKMKMGNKIGKRLLFLLILVVFSFILFQLFCLAKFVDLDLGADFFYWSVVIIGIIAIVFFFYRKKKRSFFLVISVLMLFAPIKFYYSYLVNLQTGSALKKGNEVVRQLQSYKIKNKHSPLHMGDAAIQDSSYYVGYFKYPFYYFSDGGEHFSLQFQINWQTRFQFSSTSGQWIQTE